MTGKKKPCSICSQLAARRYAHQKYGWPEDNSHLPEAAARLVLVRDLKPFSGREKKVLQCPECARYYLFETDYEYLVNGSEDEQSLTRLTLTQAAALLAQAEG